MDSFLNRLSAHPWRVAVGTLLVLLLSVAGLFTISFRHSMDVMLPKGSDTQRAMKYIQSLDFSAKVALSFSLKEGETNRTELFEAVDQMADSLKPPLVTKVFSTIEQQEMIHDIGDFLAHAPELLDETDLKKLEQKTTRDGVRKTLRKKYVQLLKPEGSFMARMIQRDPFDIQMALIEKIRALSSSFGYTMQIENNHLVSTDGKRVLLVLETDIPFTDASGSKHLVAELNKRIAALPPSISVEMICGHLHTISNEKVIRHDIRLTVSLASIAFLLLFLFYFRDLRANLIFFIPFAALLVAVNLTALLLGTLSPMMLGFGSVVSGIAVDYGIHVYIAIRRSTDRWRAVRSVTKPVLLGAFTTAGVFTAFFFSTIPGYTQLACFALFSVLLSIAGALLILPIYLKPAAKTSIQNSFKPLSSRRAWITLGIFLLLFVAAFFAGRSVSFDSDIMRLDGTEKSILQTEERFQQNWGGGSAKQAMAVVTAPTYEKALALNDRLYTLFSQHHIQAASLSPIWKSRTTRQANTDRWNIFWSPQKIEQLKTFFKEEGASFGFSIDAFDPFFTTLTTTAVQTNDLSGNRIFDQLKPRFVVPLTNEVRIFSFFPDDPQNIALLEKEQKSNPDLVLISRSAIAHSLATNYTHEFTKIVLVALGLVLLVITLLLRNPRKIFIVLTPALAGVLGCVAFARLLGTDLNVMNLVSGIIVIGLCVDYGIFYVHAFSHQLNLGTRTAISLSAGTTLIGAAALLFTQHPALYSVGITLVGGITAGYATALLLVPALCTLLLQKEGNRRGLNKDF